MPEPEPTAAREIPPVPGMGRLGWLLFMQPLKLHRMFVAWGLGQSGRGNANPTLWSLHQKLKVKMKEPMVYALVLRFAGLLLWLTPLVGFGLAGLLTLAGVPIDWRVVGPGMFFGVLIGLVAGVAGAVAFVVTLGVLGDIGFVLAFGVFSGVLFGAAFSVAIGVALGVASAFGMAKGVAGAMAGGVAGGVAFSVAPDVALGASRGVIFSVVFTVGINVIFGLFLGVSSGVFFGVANGVFSGVFSGVALLLFSFRLPTFLIEAPWTFCLATLARLGLRPYNRLARFLPFHHHDLIHFPLPGLRSFLVGLAGENPNLGRQILAEAAASVGQKRPARLALIELEALSLEKGARDRLWDRLAELDMPFLPSPDEAAGRGRELYPFQQAAEDLRAARLSTSHFHRRQALERAERRIWKTWEAIGRRQRKGPELRRRLVTLQVWEDVIEDELAALARQESERPQVPTPFVAGPALGPGDRGLFKGRQDLVGIIDHDLTRDRRAALLLFGQRRMGKSSLINMLPQVLGTGTRVVPVNFQRLGGSEHRATPHRWVAERVSEKWPEAAPPPRVTTWVGILDWLVEVERTLEKADLRLLVAIDEVERLEVGIRERWATPDFLDFVRAAADTLHRVRFLLASAHRPQRLGRHWVDRLISALPREIGFLDEDAARSLVVEPIPGFPDIYPPGGVERILEQTHRHPFLIQLVCDHLTKRLNDRGRLEADESDLEAAFDRAVADAGGLLFSDLWDTRTDDERRLLAALARGGEPEHTHGALEDLRKEGHVLDQDGRLTVAVPLFAEWIADRVG